MGRGRMSRRQAVRRWRLPGNRKVSRQAGSSFWYPQAQTQVEAGPPVTLPLAVEPTAPVTTLWGMLVAWLVMLGNGRHAAVPAAMALGFGGPELAPALTVRSA